MSGGFVKLYGTILTSSIWLEDDQTLRVWITMLATADENGYVGASVGGLAHVARVSRPACQAALDKFLAPDEDSRTEDNDGRRIEKADGGWIILNHKKYRDMRTQKQIRDANRIAGKRLSGEYDDRGPATRSNVAPDAEADRDTEELQDQKLSLPPARETGRTRSDPNNPAADWNGNVPEIKAQPWDNDAIVLRFCRLFENVESWQHLLAGYREGLGLSKGRATQAQIAQACLEAEALGGDITPRRFRRIVEAVMEKPEQKNGGNTLRAGEIIRLIQSKRNPQFPNNVVAGWLDGSGISTKEIKAVNAIGLSRILNDKNEGIVLAQLAKMLGEVRT